jgi:tRNA(fMet)-specific endonuclease VapC
MRHYLMDTSAYSRMADADPAAQRAVTGPEKLFMTPIVLGELHAGYARGSRREANEAQLAEFLAQPYVAVVPVTEATAERYAVVLSGLLREGHPIPTNDIWIAASALEHGLVVLTADRHFLQVAELRVEML